MRQPLQSVFSLIGRARQCSSDSEMILTALHCISQLKILQGKEWEWFAFTALSTPIFKNGETVAMDKVGGIDSVASCGMELEKPPGEASLNESVKFIVKQKQTSLIDRRSGKCIHLQGVSSVDELQAVVQYGKRPKTLSMASISIKKLEKKHNIKGRLQDCSSSAGISLQTFNYKVTVKRVICGGKHTITFRLGAHTLEHSFTVVGKPRNGDRVKEGPDWKKETLTEWPAPEMNVGLIPNGIGTVVHYGFRFHLQGKVYGNDKNMLNVGPDWILANITGVRMGNMRLNSFEFC